MIELNVRYTFEAPKGTISPSGIREINLFINRQRLNEGDWVGLNPSITRTWLPSLPEDWPYVWLVQTGQYRGTFPRRVSNWLYKEYGLKCPDSFVSELGNLARRHTEDNPAYHFEFMNDFSNWREGEFGDGGSCYYWSQNERVWEALASNGAWAVRFYQTDGRGLARAWFVPLPNDFYILFNGYGFVGNSTLIIARVIAAWLGAGYKKITLYNNGHSNGLVWIDDAIGYVIGSEVMISGIGYYDLRWDVPGFSCYNCGNEVHEDYTYTGIDDHLYCESCYGELFDRCEMCGDLHWREDITVTREDEYVCPYCLADDFTLCEDCWQYTRERNITVIDGQSYCPDCADDHKPPEESE